MLPNPDTVQAIVITEQEFKAAAMKDVFLACMPESETLDYQILTQNGVSQENITANDVIFVDLEHSEMKSIVKKISHLLDCDNKLIVLFSQDKSKVYSLNSSKVIEIYEKNRDVESINISRATIICFENVKNALSEFPNILIDSGILRLIHRKVIKI